MECFDKVQRPPTRADADAQGCVLVFDELARGWVARHYLNLTGAHLNLWTHMPPVPEAIRRGG